MVVALIVKRDPQANERLARANLTLEGHVDGLASPLVRSVQDEPRAKRTTLENVDARCARSVDEDVVLGWRVVVAVAEVTAVDEPKRSQIELNELVRKRRAFHPDPCSACVTRLGGRPSEGRNCHLGECLRGDPFDRATRQLVPDLPCLCVAHEHLRGDLVGRAAADRVVRRVLQQP